eukprot:1797117-Pleurochrysis_carterae.AAC.2
MRVLKRDAQVSAFAGSKSRHLPLAMPSRLDQYHNPQRQHERPARTYADGRKHTASIITTTYSKRVHPHTPLSKRHSCLTSFEECTSFNHKAA